MPPLAAGGGDPLHEVALAEKKMTSMGTVAMTLAARTTSHWPSPPCPNWSRMTLRPG
jgi:hypothetical protein